MRVKWRLATWWRRRPRLAYPACEGRREVFRPTHQVYAHMEAHGKPC